MKIKKYLRTTAMIAALSMTSLNATGCQTLNALKDLPGSIERGLEKFGKGLDPLGLKELTEKYVKEIEKNHELQKKIEEIESDTPDITSLASNPKLYLTSGFEGIRAEITVTEKSTERTSLVYQGYLPTIKKNETPSGLNIEELVLRDINTHGEYEIDVKLETELENNTSYVILLLLEDDKDNSVIYQVRNGRVNDHTLKPFKVNVQSTKKQRESAINQFDDLRESLEEANRQIGFYNAEIIRCNEKIKYYSKLGIFGKKGLAKYKRNRNIAENERQNQIDKKTTIQGEADIFIEKHPSFIEEYNKILKPVYSMNPQNNTERNVVPRLCGTYLDQMRFLGKIDEEFLKRIEEHRRN